MKWLKHATFDTDDFSLTLVLTLYTVSLMFYFNVNADVKFTINIKYI